MRIVSHTCKHRRSLTHLLEAVDRVSENLKIKTLRDQRVKNTAERLCGRGDVQEKPGG